MSRCRAGQHPRPKKTQLKTKKKQKHVRSDAFGTIVFIRFVFHRLFFSIPLVVVFFSFCTIDEMVNTENVAHNL